MHTYFDPCDLDLEVRVCVKVSKSALRFRKMLITSMSLEI